MEDNQIFSYLDNRFDRIDAYQAKQAQYQAKQEIFNATVLAELAEIKKNTITIMGSIVSDFQGITPSTKQEIEESALVLADVTEEEVHEYAVDTVTRKIVNRKELGVNKGKGRPFGQRPIKVGEIALSFDPSLKTGQRQALGNWVGNIMNKVYPNTKFKGNYHPVLRLLVTSLIGYYTAERTINSTRMY